MQDSELRIKLKEKRVDRVKRVNPSLKKFLVKFINRAGRLLFFYKKNKLPDEVKKILFISLNFYGDILFQSPLFELTKKLYPDAELHIWMKTRVSGIIGSYPYFTQKFIYDNIRTRRYDEEVNLNLKGKWEFFKKLRKEKYDLIFDVTGYFWTAFAGYIAKPKYSSGFNFQGFGFLYNFECEAIYEGHLINKHINIIVKNPLYKNYLKKYGEIDLRPVIYVSENSKVKIRELFDKQNIKSDSKKIVIHTTAGWKAKTWHIDNFISLVKTLDKNIDVFIIGGNEDIENAKLIKDSVDRNIYDLTGKFSINESAELIRRSDIFIGTDSGPLYIAEAVGTKTISLFGPTNPLFSAPRTSKNQLIYNELFCSADINEQNCKLMAGLNCKTYDCMKAIRVEDVVKNIKILMDK